MLVRMVPIILMTFCLVCSGNRSQVCILDTICSNLAKFSAVGEVEPGLKRDEEERKNEWVAQCCRNRLTVLSCRDGDIVTSLGHISPLWTASSWKMEGSRAHMDKMEPDTVAILLIALTPFFHNSNYFI